MEPASDEAAAAAAAAAALDVELFAQGARALALARETRPKNTNKAYGPKQREWQVSRPFFFHPTPPALPARVLTRLHVRQEFCAEKGFEDGELVYENKVVWFLNERVLTREVRYSRYVQKRTAADGAPVRQTLGVSAVKGYVAAITDLWSFQKSKGLNSHPNPRGEGLNGLLRARQRSEHQRRRLEFADRAAGTLQDGYDEAKMLDAVRFCWRGRPKSAEPRLRTAVDFLLAHNLLLRSESRLAAEFPDFFTLQLPGEGPTPCFPMIMIMDNGKMNQQGRLEYAAVMRHRNPLLCTMAYTAFYLFYRWNIMGEPTPTFRRRERWYGLHLVKGEDAGRRMSYDTQLEWINKMFEGANVASLKKTHAGRSQGARHAELNGVNEGQIRRAGRWNSDALTNCYLTHLPRKFMRSMAGFAASVQGNFFLPRARVPPPRSLERSVWPFVDEWLAWLDEGEGVGEGAAVDEGEGETIVVECKPEGSPATASYAAVAAASALDADEAHADRDDLAAQGFLRLLRQLRVILLQDSVIMRREFPAHPLWADPLFGRDDYRAFEKDVELSLLDVEEPEELRIRKTLPAIAERLSILHQSLARDVNEWGTRTREQLGEINARLGDLFEGRISITLNPTYAALPPPTAATVDTTTALAPTLVSAAGSTSTPFHSTFSSPAPSEASSEVVEAAEAVVPSYLLSRAISTVPQLWREWTIGLGGGPSVQGLEDHYGVRWRRKHSEKVMYGRRKVIIDEIRRRHAAGISIGAAVEEVELVRQRGALSLYQLYQLLNRQKERG